MPIKSGDKENSGNRNSILLIGEHLLNSLLEKFSSSRHVQRNRFLLLFVTALLLTIIIVPGQQFMVVKYKPGDIATTDIRATQDYLLEDRQLTEKRRSEAEATAPYVYDMDAAAAQKLTRRFEKAFAIVAEAKKVGNWSSDTAVQEALLEALGYWPTNEELGAMARIKSERGVSAEINRLSGILYNRRIVADKRLFEVDKTHGIILTDSETCQVVGEADKAITGIDITEARETLNGMRLAYGAEPKDLELIKGMFGKALQPNIIFNREATEERKRVARAAVSPVLFQVKRGEMIVRVGERITEEQVRKLEKIFEGRRGINKLFVGFGVYGLVLILFYFPYRFARKNIRKFSPSNKDIFLLSLVTLFYFVVLKVGLMTSTAMGGLLPSINTADYLYFFPFAIGPMLVRIILNSEIAFVYCAICAPLLGLMFDNSLLVVIYALMGGVVGAHGVRQCKSRGTIYNAGLKVSVVNLAMALSFQIFNDNLWSIQSVYCILFAAAGGLLNGAFVTGTIPLIENLFQYTTDIKLLELSSLNSPVLRELMVRAPGTYHHSVLVGNLVEAAAEAIHANPLLARVAAYYHDIGKISKPQYFIENLGGGENRHDKLTPSMSALILTSHVKEGAEIARENRLGLPIIDIIRQSHGTGLINFFYQKARNLAGPDGHQIDEREFRYPGPKPQTREAGLVLLADCVEAASRTLQNPTPDRIQGLVQKIINNIFIDGQLDECELTLKNLHEIAKSFNRVLAGIYHHRIDYPEPAYKEKSTGGKKPVEDRNGEPPKTSPNRDEESKKGGGEDIKRLGISR